MAPRARAWTTAGSLALLAPVLAALAAAVPVYPTAAGHYEFVAGSRDSNPYFYPPPPHQGHGLHGQVLYGGVGQQDVRGSFLTGWDRERDLYSSRYAASALPMPLPVGMAFPVGPVGPVGPVVPLVPVNHFHQPSQRLYGTRGRPAMVPTPYLKFSAHSAGAGVDKGSHTGGALQQNSLVAFPEPGFYGRSGSGGGGSQENVMLHGHHGLGHGLGYPETAAVGFYGKPI